MKYEHKMVALTHSDAETSVANDFFTSGNPNGAPYPRWKHGSESPNLGGEMEWHVVGVLPGPGGTSEPHSWDTWHFLMERELPE